MGSDHFELARLDATAQAELVRSGTASPAELCEAAIERIERVNPELNAVIGERYERARREAASELPDGPFRGVPFLVKDLSLTMAGESYHGGSRALKAADYRSAVDSYLFGKFRSAGLVTLGRTNTPEFGSTITTEPLAYGPARNPWNREHSTGGSSGGSAAAVAAGLVPMAHANDGGGSIRIPASECGLVGLKPSRGRVSSGPLSGETWMGATIEGVVTRSVRDTAAAVDAIAGAMPGDPYTAPPFARPLVAELSADAGRLRIGVCPGPVLPGGLDHPECRAAVAATAAALAELGHEVEDTYPSAIGDEEFSNRFTAVVAAWTARDLRALERELGREFGPEDVEEDNLALGAWGRSISAIDYLDTVAALQAWSRRVVEWWTPVTDARGFDLLVTPTLAGPPPRLGYLSEPRSSHRLREYMQHTAQFNITGQPAISLPMHWSEDGLPVGVQLVAAPWREDVLIRVASQLESSRPWADRVPVVHA